MNTIQNLDLKNAIKDSISSNTLEGLPTQLLDKVAPVIDVNPHHNRISNIIIPIYSATTGTLSATTLNKKFYCTSIKYHVVANATCDVATGSIALTGQINSQTVTVIRIPVITLTAFNIINNISFNNPLVFDEASTFQLGGSFTAGVLLRAVTLYGYYVERF